MKRKPLNLDQRKKEKRLSDAADLANWVIQSVNTQKAPISPLDIAESESQFLRLCCGNYRNRFDGRLEYHRKQRRFLLFYNTKYDVGYPFGQNAPRTRFSIAHELGHYFIEPHHDWLRSGGKAHGSKSEFVSDVVMEQEADIFAANLLMPHRLFRPLVNEAELTLEAIADLAECFQTSLTATAIRAVQSSDFYCAVAGIRNGVVAWSFASEPLVKAGFYPGPRGVLTSSYAKSRWNAFLRGDATRAKNAGWAAEWFREFDGGLGRKPVTEEYCPIPIMDTLLAFLNIPEDELC